MEKTCGIILLQYKNGVISVLLCKVTNSNFYSIPKGLKEENEDDYDAALRELYEETNLKLFRVNNYINSEELTEEERTLIPVAVLDLGNFDYKNRKKTLHAFVVILNQNFNFKDFKCNSTYKDKDGNEFPEVDGYIWVNIDFIDSFQLHPTQKEAIKKYLEQANARG